MIHIVRCYQDGDHLMSDGSQVAAEGRVSVTECRDERHLAEYISNAVVRGSYNEIGCLCHGSGQ